MNEHPDKRLPSMRPATFMPYDRSDPNCVPMWADLAPGRRGILFGRPVVALHDKPSASDSVVMGQSTRREMERFDQARRP